MKSNLQILVERKIQYKQAIPGKTTEPTFRKPVYSSFSSEPSEPILAPPLGKSFEQVNFDYLILLNPQRQKRSKVLLEGTKLKQTNQTKPKIKLHGEFM